MPCRSRPTLTANLTMSTRKPTSARTTPRERTKSRTATTSEEPRLDGYFAAYEPAVAKLGKELRKKLCARLPGLNEIVYLYERQQTFVISYSPNEHGYAGVCTLSLQPGEVKLFFGRGAELSKSDPNKLLRGSGKTVRYVELDKAADLDRPEIESLMEAALKLAKVRVDPQAKRAVILKVESQKQRARRVK